MMFGYDGFGFGGGMGFGMLAFWVLIVAAIVVLVRGFGSKASATRESDDTPLDILRERFAKGEIDKSEFEAMRRELSVR